MFYRRATIWAALFALFAGCTRTAPAGPVHYAFLRFENLTGDAALEWTGRAASEILSRSLAGALDGPVLTSAAVNRAEAALGSRASAVPGGSSERQAALSAGATTVVTGYVAKSGSTFRLVSQERNRILTATGTTILEALSNLAREFSTRALEPATASEQSLRQYILGTEQEDADSIANLRASLTADPNFGPAWVMLVRASLKSGDRAGAIAAVGEARTHRLNGPEKAALDLESASLVGDARARTMALREMVAASPGDLDLPRTLAESETASGDFKASAKDWEKLTTSDPKNPDVWNQLGYTRAWGGDYQGAVGAMHEYAAIKPGDPNAADSLGDVHFMYGRFREAADSYLKANTLEPDFQNSGAMFKAAWAKFRAGDGAGADALFSQFREHRRKANLNTLLQAADYLYRTGRRQEAIASLRAEGTSSNVPALRSASYSQLAVWDLLNGDRTVANHDAEEAGQPTSASALTMRFATLPTATPEEWHTRALSVIKGENADSIRRIALGYALLLDGKREAARPLWAEIAASSPGIDFFSRAIYARLAGQPKPLEIVPDPNSVNQFSALLDKL